MNRVIFWFAGADPNLIGAAPVERARYFGTGLAVLLTASTAFGGMLLLLGLITPPFVWWYTIIALLWGLLILNIDRSLVSNINYGPFDPTNTGLPPKPSLVNQIVTYGGRILLTVLIALVVSEPILLLMFRPEIKQQLHAIHEADLSKVSADVRNSSTFKDRLAAIDSALQNAKDAKRQRATETVDARKAMDAEADGTGGTRTKGCATYCDIKATAYKDAVKAEFTAGKNLTVATETHKNAVDRLETDIQSAITKQRAAIQEDNGLLNQERALRQVTAKDPGLATRRYLITGMMIFIDLLPVLIKLFGPITLHDYRVRRRAVQEALDYGDILKEEHEIQAREREARARRRQAEAEAELERENVERAHRRREADFAEEQHQLELKSRRILAKEQEQLNLEHDLQEARVRHRGRLADLTRWVVDKTRSFTKGTGSPADSTVSDGPFGSGVPTGTPGPPGPPGPSGHDDRLILNDRWVVRSEGPSTGFGGMGETRLGYDKDDQRIQVVIKRVRWRDEQDINDDAFRKESERFEIEIDRHRKVISKHVAPVLDSGFDSRFGTYIVTPLYPDTLSSRLRSGLTPTQTFVPTLEWALRITEQILLGLSHCFEQHGMVHLDIKPGNIALEHNTDQVKIIDFGLAKVISMGGDITSGGLGYTRFYAPPEQLNPAKNKKTWCSPRADVRAVAATLYDVLTGQPPLKREARAARMLDQDGRVLFDRVAAFIEMHKTTVPARPVVLLPELPAPIDDLIIRWLSPRPADRAAGPSEALAELKAARALLTADAESMWVGQAHARDHLNWFGGSRASSTSDTDSPSQATGGMS